MKWVMSRLNIYVFISFYNGSFVYLIIQARRHFFFIWTIIHIADIATLSRINVDYGFFFKYAKQKFCLVGNALSVSSNNHHQKRI